MQAKLLASLFSLIAFGVPATVLVLRNGSGSQQVIQPALQPVEQQVQPPAAIELPRQLQQQVGGPVMVPGWPNPVSKRLNANVTFAGVGRSYNVTLAYGITYFQGQPVVGGYTGSVSGGVAISSPSWAGLIGTTGWSLHVYYAGWQWYAVTRIPETWAEAWLAPMAVTSNSPLGLSGFQRDLIESITVSE